MDDADATVTTAWEIAKLLDELFVDMSDVIYPLQDRLLQKVRELTIQRRLAKSEGNAIQVPKVMSFDANASNANISSTESVNEPEGFSGFHVGSELMSAADQLTTLTTSTTCPLDDFGNVKTALITATLVRSDNRCAS